MNLAPKILTLMLRVYHAVLSPMLHFVAGPAAGCRFEPSCSVYAQEAIQQRGAVRGSWLALRRLCRCHPWGGAGHDPVPQANPGDGH